MTHTREDDMDSAEILFLLRKAGRSYAFVDRTYTLPKGTAVNTARQPHPRGEQALAKVLGLSPLNIWPSRYDASTGERLSPQPLENYRTQRILAQRQNVTPDLTCEAAA
ncbi:helix-turn-helix domain-containing protein [Pseudovibrio sp. Tun.PSC04-5.I4]|uniref:helix-turn-helix domain-containing protein n=1 Tax=Pseudovibrio sp. Tun.PSC04-5.I4 TaxID=1798213 RepID=UPI00088F9EB2|nr:helix-turn-helix domain-containing protein [Pseudovibrio sp. Tun.PSC04-5.I4]SDR08211.1 transcriptional regulator, Nlp family [Pseudovibrio sp. Tun.PSC04-5.I4]